MRAAICQFDKYRFRSTEWAGRFFGAVWNRLEDFGVAISVPDTGRRRWGRVFAARYLPAREIHNPGQYLLAEERQVGDGLVMVQQTALPHHQQMAEAADMVVEGAQLAEDVVGRAGEDEASVDRVLDGHCARVDVAAVARLDA